MMSRCAGSSPLETQEGAKCPEENASLSLATLIAREGTMAPPPVGERSRLQFPEIDTPGTAPISKHEIIARCEPCGAIILGISRKWRFLCKLLAPHSPRGLYSYMQTA